MGLWTGGSESERDREREEEEKEKEEEEETRSVDLLSLFLSDLAKCLKELWPSQRLVGSALIEARQKRKESSSNQQRKQ